MKRESIQALFFRDLQIKNLINPQKLKTMITQNLFINSLQIIQELLKCYKNKKDRL